MDTFYTGDLIGFGDRRTDHSKWRGVVRAVKPGGITLCCIIDKDGKAMPVDEGYEYNVLIPNLYGVFFLIARTEPTEPIEPEELITPISEFMK
jgi:hypothetical protein